MASFQPPSMLTPPSPTPNAPKSSPSLIPTMPEILESSRAQGLKLQLRTTGPFFRVAAEGETGLELGRADGLIRPWVGGSVLHLDSIKLSRETFRMDRSIFGLGLFIGAVAIRHGFNSGCTRAELLAINDSPQFHSKLVRYYKRMGFQVVHEVDGSSTGDLAHMLVWGGRGTRMDANIEELLLKWGKRLKPPPPTQQGLVR